LFKQEKDRLQKEIFLKNCMNLLAIAETYGIVKRLLLRAFFQFCMIFIRGALLNSNCS